MITKWKWLNLAPVPICRRHPRRHAEHILRLGRAAQSLQELGIYHFTNFTIYVNDFGLATINCIHECGQLLRS